MVTTMALGHAQAVDVILTPTVPTTAPAIPPNATTKCHSDVGKTGATMRFVQPVGQRVCACTSVHVCMCRMCAVAPAC